MALIVRFFAILFGFLAACFVAGAVVVWALLFPEMVELSLDPVGGDALNIILGFGFVLLSGFALLSALVAVFVTDPPSNVARAPWSASVTTVIGGSSAPEARLLGLSHEMVASIVQVQPSPLALIGANTDGN